MIGTKTLSLSLRDREDFFSQMQFLLAVETAISPPHLTCPPISPSVHQQPSQQERRSGGISSLHHGTKVVQSAVQMSRGSAWVWLGVVAALLICGDPVRPLSAAACSGASGPANQLFYQSSSGELLGPYPAEHVDYWFQQGYLHPHTLVAPSPQGLFVPISAYFNRPHEVRTSSRSHVQSEHCLDW